jgi:hypothetical protein
MKSAMQLSPIELAPLRAIRVATGVAVWSSIIVTRLAVPYLAAFWGM